MTTQRRKAKLHSLQKREAKRYEEGKRKKLFDFWSLIVFVATMLLLIWAIEIYRITFIDWRVLAIPAIIGGFFGILLSWRKLAAFGYPVWSIFMIGIGIGSSIPYFIFLYGNQKFAETIQTTEVFDIERMGRFASGRGSCGQPYTTINFYGLTKDIVFTCNDIDKINNYSKVRITCSKGFFGYDIIRRKSLEY